VPGTDEGVGEAEGDEEVEVTVSEEVTGKVEVEVMVVEARVEMMVVVEVDVRVEVMVVVGEAVARVARAVRRRWERCIVGLVCGRCGDLEWCARLLVSAVADERDIDKCFMRGRMLCYVITGCAR